MSQPRETIGLGMILALSGLLNSWNITFPLGYHFDEPKKVRFIQTGTQDFRQPLLILQLTRLANAVAGFRDAQAIAVLGRTITAAGGVLLVWLTYQLGRSLVAPCWALLAAALTAVSPLVVIHAHYLKEDIWLTVWLLLGLLAIERYYLRQPGRKAALTCGLLCGLAAATHYKGLLLAVLFALSPWLAGAAYDKRFASHLLGFLAALVGVFMLVNAPLLWHPEVFWSGAVFQARHVVEGHTLFLLPTDYFGAFHLLWSLAPGLGWGATLGSLAATARVLWEWRSQSAAVRLLTAYALLFYAVVELSPLKPDPNYERYVVPLAPAAMLLTTQLLEYLWNRSPSRTGRGAVAAAAASCFLFPATDSIQLVYDLEHDTRVLAAEWMEQHGARAWHESHSGTSFDIQYAADADLDELRRGGVTHLVTSSFAYERSFRGQRLRSRQSDDVYRRAARYAELFEHYPYIEFQPRYRSFAFSNPVIRIVDIRPRASSSDSSAAER